ncbi:SIMPL domain-containing protein [Uliginosibacterium gangwonense]|uniref:SIMPL domain-containing protein n=1 Tax=Uliginosibacterium gangwonense TaxID=392736 RepID=UPI00037D5F7C|nr:SIMPL domain-containing protein [Uliginosibacterium gangwonense]
MSDNTLGRGLFALGISLAIGLILAAFVLGYQARQAAEQRQTITVKGLAEKPVRADHGQFGMNLQATGSDPAHALANLRAQQPRLQAFFKEQGFSGKQIEIGNEDFAPVFKPAKQGEERTEISHYIASQNYVLQSNDVQQIAKTVKASLGLREAGMLLEAHTPLYLVSNLEDIKMSLIGAATQNAQTRANEFAKNGNAHIGVMKSASQGAFYILPANGESDTDNDYGGAYDKSTIEKRARVVVTIQYSIAP